MTVNRSQQLTTGFRLPPPGENRVSIRVDHPPVFPPCCALTPSSARGLNVSLALSRSSPQQQFLNDSLPSPRTSHDKHAGGRDACKGAQPPGINPTTR